MGPVGKAAVGIWQSSPYKFAGPTAQRRIRVCAECWLLYRYVGTSVGCYNSPLIFMMPPLPGGLDRRKYNGRSFPWAPLELGRAPRGAVGDCQAAQGAPKATRLPEMDPKGIPKLPKCSPRGAQILPKWSPRDSWISKNAHPSSQEPYYVEFYTQNNNNWLPKNPEFLKCITCGQPNGKLNQQLSKTTYIYQPLKWKTQPIIWRTNVQYEAS